MKVIANISRVLVGILFIFSGLIKANDPLGFAYKLHDYYEVFGEYTLLQIFDNPIFYNLALETSMIICIVEVVLGIALLLGYRMQLVSWTLLIMIVGFTFLTGFSAITGKVTDCGCFGDAIPLTPWQSFYKDLILLVLIGVIFNYRKKYKPLFPKERSATAVLGLLTVLSVIFTLMAYHHLPFIDFRPYKAGNNVCELRTLPPDAQQAIYESTLIYRNKETGKEKEFTLENFPKGDDWAFVRQNSVLIQEGDRPVIKNFTLSDSEGNDVTEAFLQQEGYKMLVICYDISATVTRRIDEINTLQQKMEAAGIPVYGVTASGAQQVEAFRHRHQTAFPFWFSDETELKTIVRSNPGLVLFNGCTIVKKWHWRDVPSFTTLQEQYFKQ